MDKELNQEKRDELQEFSRPKIIFSNCTNFSKNYSNFEPFNLIIEF